MAALSKPTKQWKNSNPREPSGTDKYVRYFICGKTRSGKTYLAAKLAKRDLETGAFDAIIVISPTCFTDDSMVELFTYIKKEKVPIKIYTTFNSKTYHQEMFDTLKANAREGMSTLLFIDDQNGNSTFTRASNQTSVFNQLTSTLSHWKTRMYYMSQATSGMSKQSRLNQEVFIYFSDFAQRKELHECCTFVTRREFDRLMDTYAGEKRRALWINVQYGNLGVYAMDPYFNFTPVESVPPQ